MVVSGVGGARHIRFFAERSWRVARGNGDLSELLRTTLCRNRCLGNGEEKQCSNTMTFQGIS